MFLYVFWPWPSNLIRPKNVLTSSVASASRTRSGSVLCERSIASCSATPAAVESATGKGGSWVVLNFLWYAETYSPLDR